MLPLFKSVPADIVENIARVIKREGGFVDNSSDPGGATKFGITQATLQAWRKEPVDRITVMYLTKDEAIQIYYHMYWLKLNLNHIEDNWIKEFLFDWCVNAGLKNPIRQIQRLVGVKSDGVIGPVTTRAISSWMRQKSNRGWSEMTDCRVRWYIRLVESRHTNIVFMEGWFNRANEMRYTAPPFTVTVK